MSNAPISCSRQLLYCWLCMRLLGNIMVCCRLVPNLISFSHIRISLVWPWRSKHSIRRWHALKWSCPKLLSEGCVIRVLTNLWSRTVLKWSNQHATFHSAYHDVVLIWENWTFAEPVCSPLMSSTTPYLTLSSTPSSLSHLPLTPSPPITPPWNHSLTFHPSHFSLLPSHALLQKGRDGCEVREEGMEGRWSGRELSLYTFATFSIFILPISMVVRYQWSRYKPCMQLGIWR